MKFRFLFATFVSAAIPVVALADDDDDAAKTKATTPAPPVSAADAAQSPFGVATSAQSSGELDDWLPTVSGLGVCWLRGFDIFGDIEPQRGTWNWKGVDAILDSAAANHMQVSGLFFYGSRWINSPDTLPTTTDASAWADYVTATIKHVNGRVKYWEMWNESPNFTHEATPASYAKLVSTTYDAAHAADPSCQVGLCAQSVNLTYLDQALAAGAAGHFDYVALHPYESLGCVNAGFEPEFMSIVPTVRKMLAARDPAHANAPVWFTEIGAAIEAPKGRGKVTPQVQADLLVKACTMGLAQGVTRIDWFEGRDGDSGPMGLYAPGAKDAATSKPALVARPAAKAMKMLIDKLGHQPVYLGWELLNSRDYAFLFEGRDHGPVLIAWAPPGQTDEIEMGDGVDADNPDQDDDLRGGAVNLTNSPTVMTGKIGRKFLDAAAANKDKPLAWGGDFSGAKSVSIQFGAPNAEKGLHLLDANPAAGAAMVDGKAARNCARSGAETFAVDPNFLSYTTTPIVITAVARRDAANNNAGFNLKYESTTGLKVAGRWTSISEGNRWATLRWTITDPQFVGKWGYNFSFDSDTPGHAKYLLQSVTVTKK